MPKKIGRKASFWQVGLMVALLATVGYIVSCKYPVISVSLPYSLGITITPFVFSPQWLAQIAIWVPLLLLVRLIPFFIGVIISNYRPKFPLYLIAGVGLGYEMIRAVVHGVSWSKQMPMQVPVTVMMQLYPLLPRVLAAGTLAVLGALVWQAVKKDRKIKGWSWVLLVMVGLLVVLAM